MYTLTFNSDTIMDLLDYRYEGRQMYGAIVIPYSGVFTTKSDGTSVKLPQIMCPYQINDIFAIQEQWARSGSSYIYKDYSESAEGRNSGYNFRPATTMPISAARLYGRIVSIQPWSITEDIINNYLTIGMSLDSYAGAAKVIGYWDSGNRILSKLRNAHNKKALNKTYQPFVGSNPVLITSNRRYIMSKNMGYSCFWIYSDDDLANISGLPTYGTTLFSQVTYNPMAEYDYSAIKTNADGTTTTITSMLKDGTKLDYNGTKDGWWTRTLTYRPKSYNELIQIKDEQNLYYRGEAWWSTESNPEFIYIVCDRQGYASPRYATYSTKMVDPNQYLHAWLISAYLCDASGNIIGDVF